MKGNPCLHTRRIGTALFLFAAALAMSMGFVQVNQLPATSERNNPQDFYLWSTGSSFAGTFRYDPRAADIWLFKAGGDARFNLRDAFDLPASRTNR